MTFPRHSAHGADFSSGQYRRRESADAIGPCEESQIKPAVDFRGVIDRRDCRARADRTLENIEREAHVD
jgi:hypothetical protein